MTSLTQAVIRYKAQTGTSLEREALLREITNIAMVRLYSRATRLGVRSEEDAADFVLYIVSALERIIESYSCGGLDFEGYLEAVARRRVVSYYSSLKKRRRRMALSDLVLHRGSEERAEEEAAEMEAGQEGRLAAEAAPGYELPPPEGVGEDMGGALSIDAEIEEMDRTGRLLPLRRIARVCRSSFVWRKRMLVYMFYVMPSLTPWRLALVARVFDMEMGELAEARRHVVQRLASRYDKRKAMMENMNIAFYRLIGVETALNTIMGGDDRPLEERKMRFMDTCKTQVGKKMRYLTSKRNFLSQTELAEVFSLPRGTVSSFIHYARLLAECAVDPSSPMLKRLPSPAREVLLDDGLDQDRAPGGRACSIEGLLERLRMVDLGVVRRGAARGRSRHPGAGEGEGPEAPQTPAGEPLAEETPEEGPEGPGPSP